MQCHVEWWFIICLQRWLHPRYGMTNEGLLWCQMLLFQFGICPHGIPALLPAFTFRMAHFVCAFTEHVLITYFPYGFPPGFLNSNAIDFLDQMILCFGSCPVNLWWLAGLYPLVARSTFFHLSQSKMCLGIAKYSLKDKTSSSWEPLV